MPQFLLKPKLICVEIKLERRREEKRREGERIDGDLPSYYKEYINNMQPLLLIQTFQITGCIYGSLILRLEYRLRELRTQCQTKFLELRQTIKMEGKETLRNDENHN